MVDKAKESAAQTRTELKVNQMIGYSNPNQDLIDQNNLSGLNGTQKVS